MVQLCFGVKFEGVGAGQEISQFSRCKWEVLKFTRGPQLGQATAFMRW